jgi:crotonobetainyl-CoA:carnitine CoA-transferase CaiB-like acyl-CoA transferase
MSELPAYEIAAQARSGMVHVCREPDGPPIIFPGGVGDITGAAFAAIGILSGLVARGHLNRGQKIDTSLLGSLLQVVALQIGSSGIAGEIYPQRSRSRMGNPLWNYYKCADGKWINFAMLQPDKYWHNFCYAVGIPELEKDPRFNNLTVRARNALELIDILDRIFITKTREEWLKQLDKSGVDLIYGPIQTIPEVLQDPQVLANEYVVDFEHPVFGPIKYVGVPHLFSETPANPRKAAPEFGQHTEEILIELGYTCEDIGRFKDKGVI